MLRPHSLLLAMYTHVLLLVTHHTPLPGLIIDPMFCPLKHILQTHVPLTSCHTLNPSHSPPHALCHHIHE